MGLAIVALSRYRRRFVMPMPAMPSPLSQFPTSQFPTSHTYISQRLPLHYLDWGNPDAPPLVLIHGGRDHARSWDWVAERLRDRWHIIAPDLRGHGDSPWKQEGTYDMPGFICDLAELVHQLKLEPVTLVGHSLGGNIATRYAGIFPRLVKRLVSIEGLGLSPKAMAAQLATPLAERMRLWVEAQRNLAGLAPHRYKTIDEVIARMQQAHKHLSPGQASHLARHGVNSNDDGTWSWKFDPHLRVFPPVDIAAEEVERLWANVACPTLLVYGRQSWASNPLEDGRARHFKDARVVLVENAGHWVHHNQTDFFVKVVREFLEGP
jgi:pimeloyl-ACP methyl ester carboxylesterase